MNTKTATKRQFIRVVMILFICAWIFSGLGMNGAQAYAGTYAINFDGLTEAVRIGETDQAQVILPDCLNTKSVALWVRPLGTPPTALGAGNADNIVGDNPRWWGISRGIVGGLDRIWFYNDDTVTPAEIIPTTYTTGEWVHLAYVHAGGVLSAYKNGVLINSLASDESGINACLTLTFGGSTAGSAPKFEGQIDELSIWSRGLTAAEIRDLMYRELSGSEADLEVYYKMSNGSGATVTDDSNNTYDGTFVGSPEWVTSGALAGPDNALDFDGADDFVTVPAALAMPASLTLEAWVLPRDISAGQKWIAGEVGGAQLTLDGTTAQFSIHNGTTLQGPATASLLGAGWQHVAGTYDGSTLRIYVNGVEGTSFSAAGSNTDQGGAFTIGSTDGSSMLNNMQVDELRLWNFARSADAIRSDMLQTLRGDEAGLLAYYRFDQYNGDAAQTTLYDITTNNNDGTLTSMSPASDWMLSTAFNTWIGADSTDWAAGGNWSRSGVPLASDYVGVYAHPLGNNPTLSTTESANALLIAGGASLTIDAAGSLDVPGLIYNLGTLVNNGLIQQSLPVSGSGNFQFVGGTYGGLILNPNGDDLGLVTVAIRGNQDCTTVANETVKRCFDITSTTLPVNGSVMTFFFNDSEESGNLCSTLNAFHYNDGAWSGALTLDPTYASSGRDCGANPRSLRVTGVTGFSPFALKSESAPTAVTLVRFGGSSLTGILATGVSFLAFVTLGVLIGLNRKRILNHSRRHLD